MTKPTHKTVKLPPTFGMMRNLPPIKIRTGPSAEELGAENRRLSAQVRLMRRFILKCGNFIQLRNWDWYVTESNKLLKPKRRAKR